MKSILIALFLVATTSTTLFAATEPTTVAPSVLRSFKTTFAQASNADWTRTEDLYRVAFLFRNQYITAYYNADGNLEAITRHITADNLPMLLQTRLEKSATQWVSDVFEVTKEGSVQYYITLEDAATQLIYKSTGGNWTLYQKTKKA